MPKGKASLMANLCMDIILDANNDQLEESTYLSVLDDFWYLNEIPKKSKS